MANTLYTCHYKARQTTGFVGHLTIEVPAVSGRDARLFAGQALSLLVPDSSGWEWSHGSKSDLLETVATLNADQAEALQHAARDREKNYSNSVIRQTIAKSADETTWP